ncbi:MAG TPA: hypothetical protein VIE89_03595 [Candidatus Binatia bacterium]
MESTKQFDHTSLVDINDEILAAQVRLMELYVKQAHATAANDAAIAQERFQAELTTLRNELQQKELALEAHQTVSDQANRHLRAELTELQIQLLTSQRLLEDRKADLDAARLAATELRERVAQLELTIQEVQASSAIEIKRSREVLETELANFKRQLEQKESALQMLQNSAREAEDTLATQVRDLHDQFVAKTDLLENRTAELQSAHSEIEKLRQHIRQLDLNEAQRKAAANEEIRIRENLEAELIALRTALEQKDLSLQQSHSATRVLEERFTAQLHDLQNQLAAEQQLLESKAQEVGELTAKTGNLEEQITRLELTHKQAVNEAKALEDSLRARVEELEAKLSENTRALHGRTAELESARSETALLHQRVQQLERIGAQTEAQASKAAQVRENLEAELIALRKASEQKDVELEQHHAHARILEERLNTELHDLRAQLAEKQGLLEVRSQEVNELTTTIDDLQEQITCLELTNKQTIKEAKAATRALEESLRARVQELEATVSEKTQALHGRTAELESAQSEAALLRQRIEQLELVGAQAEEAKSEADRRWEALENELGNVHQELAEKNRSFAQREAELKESRDLLDTQLQNLQNQLAAEQQLLNAKDEELAHAATRMVGLEARVTELESLRAEAEAAAAAEVARVRTEFQSEISSLQASLSEKDQELQRRHAAIAEFEANNKQQIEDLRNQLGQKQELLENRDREVQGLGSETALLRERIGQLETAAAETQRSAAAEGERVRAELATQLVSLQEQLKESELQSTARHELVKESEDRLRAEIDDLQIQVSEKQLLLEARAVEIADLWKNLTAVSDKLAQLETDQRAATAAAENAALQRQKIEAELGARQEELKNLERFSADRDARFSAVQQTLTAELQNLQKELAAKQELLETRSQEVGELTAKTNDLQEQITCLELANKQTVKEATAAARALEDTLSAQVQELQEAVSVKGHELQARTVELESARSEASLLRQRIEQLEVTSSRSEETRSDADRRREALEDELDNLHQVLEMKDRSFAERENEFKESGDLLNTQLHNLQNQLAEERVALENRERDVQNAQSEIVILQQQVQELQAAKAATETSAFAERDRFIEQYQHELAELREALHQKQLALDACQSTIVTLEGELSSRKHQLEAERTKQQTLSEQARRELAALREELAQSELSRKQSELLAAAQAEQIREGVKKEIGVLDGQLKEKENALNTMAEERRELESALNARIVDLETALTGKQSLTERKSKELIDLQSQITALLAQIHDLERSSAKAQEEQRVAAGRVEQELHLQVTELQAQLAEKLTLLASRQDEVQALESKITDLTARIGQAEVSLKQAEAATASEINQIRRQSQAELAERQAETDRKVEALQQREAALNLAEQNRQIEINGLRAEVAEKHALLQDRNDELLRVKAELDILQERIAYLEATAKRAEIEFQQKAEQAEELTRIELDKLWDKLTQKGQALEERQVAVNDLEQNFQAQVDSLRNELAEKEALLENPSKEFLIGESTLTESQKDKLNRLEQLVETIKADNEQMLISPRNRRWHFGLGRKRRWKS